MVHDYNGFQSPGPSYCFCLRYDINSRPLPLFEQFIILTFYYNSCLIIFSQIVLSQGLPFDVTIPDKIPNETTRKALAEKDLVTFETPEELFEDLGIQ